MALDNRINISHFVKLTGTTLKTVLYYHKIGLLPEPERSSGGYRLYGPADLTRMQFVRRLKSLGLDLPRIKTVLGDVSDQRTLREVLESLRKEIIFEKKSLEERLAKIDKLLTNQSEDAGLLDEDVFESPSFQMTTEILGPEKVVQYAQNCPEILDQHRQLFGIIDEFRWGDDYQKTFLGLAEFFQVHPEQYQISLNFGARLAQLEHLPENDPEVEALARESAEFIKSIPQLKALLCDRPGIKKPFGTIHDQMVSSILSPAQMKHKRLLEQYLNVQS